MLCRKRSTACTIMNVSLRVILKSRFPTIAHRLTFWFNREMMIGWGTVYQWDVSLLVTQRHVTHLIPLGGITKMHYRVSIGDPIFHWLIRFSDFLLRGNTIWRRLYFLWGSILLSQIFFLCDWSSLFSLLTGILVFALLRSCMQNSSVWVKTKHCQHSK